MNSSNDYEYSESKESFPLLDSESLMVICESENNFYFDKDIFCTENNEKCLYANEDIKAINEGAEFVRDEEEQKCIKLFEIYELPNIELNIDDKQDRKLISFNGVSEGTPQTETKDFPLLAKDLKLHKARDRASLIKNCAFQHKIINNPSIGDNEKLIQEYSFQVKISFIMHREKRLKGLYSDTLIH